VLCVCVTATRGCHAKRSTATARRLGDHSGLPNALPPRLHLNLWALSGEWSVKAEAALLNAAGGRLTYRFHARDLHLVMGPAERRGAVRFRASIDGQSPGAGHGSDVDEHGNGTVTEQRLYQLIRQSGPISERQFEIEFLDSGVEAFAFTFG